MNNKNGKIHVKKDDMVVIISGDDKSAKGKLKVRKVLEVSPKEGKVIVEGANMVTKHVKPKKQGQVGGRIQAEAAMYASKVMLVCPKCKQPTRVGYKTLEDGSKVRVCKRPDCRETFN